MSRSAGRRRRAHGSALVTGGGAPVILAALAVLALLDVAPAHAYVRYLTDSGEPFHWSQTCVPLVGFPNDLPEMNVEDITAATTAAARAWSADELPCTYMRINVEMSSRPTVRARFDSANYLIFRSDSWCRQTDSAASCANYDPSALAITSVFVNTRDGRIRDGDIEVNAATSFVWANLDTSSSGGPELQDLQNALTHEMGHLIGLDHTCYGAGLDRPRPNDHTGQAIPDCDRAPQAVRETTMFASADKGDISKRTLEADDQLAVCDIYPTVADPQFCPAANLQGGAGSGDGCGCAAAGVVDRAAQLASLAFAAGLALTAALARARRRKPSG